MANDQYQQEVKYSLFKLLWGVLFRPRRTLTYLKDNRKRTWWLPAALILVLTVTPLLVGSVVAGRQAVDVMTMEPRMDEPVYGSGAPSVVVVEGEPGMMEPPSSPPQAVGPGLLQIVGAIPGTIIAWLIWGVALYSASVFLGRSSSFGQMFRLTVWAWMPYAVRGLVQTIYILATGDQIVNRGLSGFVIDKNASSLVPVGPGKLALAGALGRVEVYLFWSLALLVFGLMAFTDLPRKKALITVFVIWAVLTLLGIIPAILGGFFG
jgi:hypothetical protein